MLHPKKKLMIIFFTIAIGWTQVSEASLTEMCLAPKFSQRVFLYCNKIPKTISLKEEGFLFAGGFGGSAHGAWLCGALHHCENAWEKRDVHSQYLKPERVGGERVWVSMCPSRTLPPLISLPPSRPHLLRVSPPPRNVTGWGLSSQHGLLGSLGDVNSSKL